MTIPDDLDMLDDQWENREGDAHPIALPPALYAQFDAWADAEATTVDALVVELLQAAHAAHMTQMVRSPLGKEELRCCRLALDYSQQAMAAALGVSVSVIAKWESGQRLPREPEHIRRIIAGLFAEKARRDGQAQEQAEQ